VKRATKAFWQGVFASLLASLLLEGARGLSGRAEEMAEDADVGVPASLNFLEALSPLTRLGVVAGAGFALGLGLFLGMQRLGIKVAALVLPTLAVAAIVGAYLWLVF
jgi:hypothetical protein